MSAAQRKFLGEIAMLLDKSVMVITTDNKIYTGSVVGLHPETLNLCLADATDEKGQNLNRIFLNGNVVAQILTVEKPFNLKALADRLEKVFPNMVRLYADNGFIWVMDKIKVTEVGVVEGTGPIAERVINVYNQFIRETKK